MRPPRGLSPAEQAAWARLAQSVTPLPGKRRPAPPPPPPAPTPPAAPPEANEPAGMAAPKRRSPSPPRAPAGDLAATGLDSHWERRLRAGRIAPDLTLDLHGYGLDAAHARVMDALDQARSMGARVVLVVAGRARAVDPADRLSARGAIRAVLLDWLAASRHASAIAAVRRAHLRHGGEGALYLILRRQ
ncbi:MAG: Smr/MutS family protein [Erythrobacter cryptus]